MTATRPNSSRGRPPRRPAVEDKPDQPSREKLDPDALAALEEERDFLLRSIDDLELEHDAGDIDDDDYRELSDAYVARTAEVLRAIEERRLAFEHAGHQMSTRAKVLTTVGVLAVALLAGVLVAHFSGGRQAGDEISGSGAIPKTTTQQAEACVNLTSAGKAGSAITCFQTVLGQDPSNPTALTYLGWTLVLSSSSLSGSTAQKAFDAGADFIQRAIKSDPTFPDAYAFEAIIADKEGKPAQAKAALTLLAGLDPPAEISQLVAGLGSKVDAELKAASSSSTTTTAPPAKATTTTLAKP